MANKLSLYGLISQNGVYASPSATTDSNPTLIDLSTEKIAYVSVISASLQDGTLVDAFEIVCSNLKGYERDVYLVKVTPDHCADIDAFFTGLSTITADTTFTKYTDLLAINGATVASKTVIVNDLHMKNRRYVPAKGTYVFVDIHNAYAAHEFLFAGDQTVAGGYTYFPA